MKNLLIGSVVLWLIGIVACVYRSLPTATAATVKECVADLALIGVFAFVAWVIGCVMTTSWDDWKTNKQISELVRKAKEEENQ